LIGFNQFIKYRQYFSQIFNITANIGGESVSFYSPKKMDATITNLNGNGNISKANGIDIEWTTDIAIQNNPVVVVVEYNPLASVNQASLTNDTSLIAKRFDATEIDGAIFIAGKDLDDFPVGGTLTVNIGRGNIAMAGGPKEYKVLSYVIQHITGRKLSN
jgi:hypothetical protein